MVIPLPQKPKFQKIDDHKLKPRIFQRAYYQSKCTKLVSLNYTNLFFIKPANYDEYYKTVNLSFIPISL